MVQNNWKGKNDRNVEEINLVDGLFTVFSLGECLILLCFFAALLILLWISFLVNKKHKKFTNMLHVKKVKIKFMSIFIQ